MMQLHMAQLVVMQPLSGLTQCASKDKGARCTRVLLARYNMTQAGLVAAAGDKHSPADKQDFKLHARLAVTLTRQAVPN